MDITGNPVSPIAETSRTTETEAASKRQGGFRNNPNHPSKVRVKEKARMAKRQRENVRTAELKRTAKQKFPSSPTESTVESNSDDDDDSDEQQDTTTTTTGSLKRAASNRTNSSVKKRQRSATSRSLLKGDSPNRPEKGTMNQNKITKAARAAINHALSTPGINDKHDAAQLLLGLSTAAVRLIDADAAKEIQQQKTDRLIVQAIADVRKNLTKVNVGKRTGGTDTTDDTYLKGVIEAIAANAIQIVVVEMCSIHSIRRIPRTCSLNTPIC